MSLALAVLAGGAFGALLRYLLSKEVQRFFGTSFPAGTMAVNLVGAFLVGLFFALLVEKLAVRPEVRAFLITGLLGGLTTFSTFSYESYRLLTEGEWTKFFLYFGGTNLTGLFLTFLGFQVGRWL